MAQKMSHVFTAQKEGAAQMTKGGHKNAHWLPLACQPEAHIHIPYNKIHDIAFVGFLNTDWKECDPKNHNRVEWLDNIMKAFPKTWIATNVFFEEMAVQFCRAKLGFNISIRQDLNMRFFEVLSTGTALLSNTDQVGWKELGFVDGEDFIGYKDWDDFQDKAAYYLEHDAEREKIAHTGLVNVRKNHTYFHRMQEMLETIGIECPIEANKLADRFEPQAA